MVDESTKEEDAGEPPGKDEGDARSGVIQVVFYERSLHGVCKIASHSESPDRGHVNHVNARLSSDITYLGLNLTYRQRLPHRRGRHIAFENHRSQEGGCVERHASSRCVPLTIPRLHTSHLISVVKCRD